MLLIIYLCPIPQPHMLSKRITICWVLFVTHLDAIEEFVQQAIVTIDPTLRVNCNTMKNQL